MKIVINCWILLIIIILSAIRIFKFVAVKSPGFSRNQESTGSVVVEVMKVQESWERKKSDE